MSATYKLCKLLIERGKTDGLMDKLDAYLAADRLTVQEYNDLVEMLERKTGMGD